MRGIRCFPGRLAGCIRGRAADDVYAVGYGSTILHFDGRRWRVLDDPDGPATNDLLTGIAFHPIGNVLISGKSRGGRVLRGSADQASPSWAATDPLIGMAEVDGRLFLAATRGGAAELTGDGLQILRDDLVPWSVAEGRSRVYFTITPDDAAYMELDLASGQWQQLSYR